MNLTSIIPNTFCFIQGPIICLDLPMRRLQAEKGFVGMITCSAVRTDVFPFSWASDARRLSVIEVHFPNLIPNITGRDLGLAKQTTARSQSQIRNRLVLELEFNCLTSERARSWRFLRLIEAKALSACITMMVPLDQSRLPKRSSGWRQCMLSDSLLYESLYGSIVSHIFFLQNENMSIIFKIFLKHEAEFTCKRFKLCLFYFTQLCNCSVWLAVFYMIVVFDLAICNTHTHAYLT
ncbi:hypothetical protein DFH27DRAFT_533268 [Peziza echinospora]|nr:hypothetical protein DFH27DRAFT_533268 [Peziza echinospora]